MKTSKKDALMKNLLCETAAVIHVGEGGRPTTVALVEVEKAGTDMKKLETAFMKTNSINEAWYTSEDVEFVGPKPGCRSTSVGDFVVVGTTKYVCETAGWNAPARNAARGNILAGGYAIDWTGPLYL